MKNRFLPVVFLALATLLGGGCAVVVVGAAAGAGAIIYHKGELRSSEAVNYDNAWNASLAGLKDLNYVVVDQTKGGLKGRIIARAPGDKKVTVDLEKESGTVTRIGIRIGTVGNEAQSRIVLDAIKKHL